MIKFPKMHIASSVVNRILNIADGVNAAVISPSLPADVPDPSISGGGLDAALATPIRGLPPIDQAPAPGRTLGGTPLLSTVLEPDT